MIVDLGGGSLEVSFLRGRKVTRAMAMPLGAVRLMEMFHVAGSFTPEAFARVRRRVLAMLDSQSRAGSQAGRGAVVACGGNAEALARLAPGPRVAGFGTINLRRLDEMLWEILERSVEERMEAFGVRRDRAEVMGVAAVVFTTLGEWLGARQLVVPAVGVREGILHDLAAAHFGPATAHDERAEALRQQARRFAARMHSDSTHCEQVRKLAVQLFHQLAPVHGLAPEQRVPLELAALLHDAGRAVHALAHHKHGEYLVRHADIPGLDDTSSRWSLAWSVITASPRPSRTTACIALWLPPNGCACGNWPRCCASPWLWTRTTRRPCAESKPGFNMTRCGCAWRPGGKRVSTCANCGARRAISSKSLASTCDSGGYAARNPREANRPGAPMRVWRRVPRREIARAPSCKVTKTLSPR